MSSMSDQEILKKIKIAMAKSLPLTVTTYKLSHETELYIEKILFLFLKTLGQEKLGNNISYCMKELAVNAKKANTKRVYFKELNLSLNDSEEYQKGMKNFKNDTLSNINYYLEKQKEQGLYIKISFKKVGNSFKITVRNNVEITKKEQMRIYDRVARSRAFSSMEEAFSEVLDDSEGAGLGIVIMVLMLRKIGLDEEAFEIEGVNGETISSLTIPMSKVKVDELNLLSEKIIDQIEKLPQFPENIQSIQRLINNPESEISEIARLISTDPSLTADLLKLVNSAQFMLVKRVDNITEAVKMVGLRGLKNLLFSYGSDKILNMTDQKELWDHAHKTAFYSFNLAKNIRLPKDSVDDAYVGGILHDMGKIIFSNIHPNLLNKIRNFSSDKSLEPGLIEELTAGINHAYIGSKIAEKWNFSEALIQGIRYHHEPLEAPMANQKVVFCIYLANILCNFQNKLITFDQIEPSVLRFFNIPNEEKLQEISHKLTLAFNRELKV